MDRGSMHAEGGPYSLRHRLVSQIQELKGVVASAIVFIAKHAHGFKAVTGHMTLLRHYVQPW